MFANAATLLHYVGYKGFSLTAEAIKKHQMDRDPAMMAATLRRRPFDLSRYVKSKGGGKSAPRRFPEWKTRWSDCAIGTEISLDTIEGHMVMRMGD